MSLLYTIRDWDQFENNRSRSVDVLNWVVVPNRHDGENYTKIVTHKDGAEIFSAWNLILQVGSKCQPRGVLVRGSGEPHDANSLALKTRAPEAWFDKALKFLPEHTDWLLVTDFTEVVLPDSRVTGDYQSSGLRFPDVLKTTAFKLAWGKWIKHRREIKKPLTQESVRQQLQVLAGIGEDRAIACIEYTIGKGWQGLAFAESHNGTHQQNHSGSYQRLTGAALRKSHFGAVKRDKPLSILLREKRNRDSGGGQPSLPLATPPPKA